MYFKYLWYVIRHKWFVFLECCKLGIPWRGIVHDLHKFSPKEFGAYARYFYGDYRDESEIRFVELPYSQKTKQSIKCDFDLAWLHHQKHPLGAHHWQYWLLQYDNERTFTIQSPGDGYGLMLCENKKHLLWFTAADYKDDAFDSEAWRRLVPIIDLLNKKPVALPMPEKAVLEMVADWRGAGRAISGKDETKEWYAKNKDNMILHTATRNLVEKMLG